MIIVGVDTETTGIPDVAEASGYPPREIVEFGYCIYDTEAKQPLAGGYDIFEVDTWDDMAEEAVKKHRITKVHTEVAGLKCSDFEINRILRYKPRVVIAHNAAFDYDFIIKNWPELGSLEWLCSFRDLDHSKFVDSSSYRLMHLAMEYGFPVVGWHRAYHDAEMVCKIASVHNLEEAMIMKKLPKYKVSTIGPFNDHMRLKLKELRFRWADKQQHPPRGVWWKDNVTEIELPSIKDAIFSLAPNWSTTVDKMDPSY